MKTKISDYLSKKINFTNRFNFFQPNILSHEWNREVFKLHNKEYGAYQLRLHYHQTISKALLISFSSVLLFLMLHVLLRSNHQIINADNFITDVITPEIFNIPTPPEKKSEPIASKPHIENAPVAITKDSIALKKPDEKPIVKSGSGNGTDTTEVKTPVGGKGIIASGNPKTDAGDFEKDSSVTWAPVMPEFPGGMDALSKFISKKVKTNNIWRESGNEGKVVYEFVIGKDGKVRDVKIMKDGVSFGIAELNLAIFDNMPVWKPGKNNDHAVSVLYRLPIKFVKE